MPGGDPDEMVRLARALDGAAAELRRLRPHLDAAVVAAGRPPTPVLAPLGRAVAWADGAAGEVRRRARDLAADGPSDGDRFRPPPFLGAQRGKKNLRLTDAEAQMERAKDAARDPAGGRRARKAETDLEKAGRKSSKTRRSRPGKDAKPPQGGNRSGDQKAHKALTDLEKTQSKVTGNRRSRPRKDAKPSPGEKAASRQAREKAKKAKRDAAGKGAALATAVLGVWWAGKVLSPMCGPAAPACAVVL